MVFDHDDQKPYEFIWFLLAIISPSTVSQCEHILKTYRRGASQTKTNKDLQTIFNTSNTYDDDDNNG